MALEHRGKQRYFYESYRTPTGKVRKRYIGGGAIGQMAADDFAALQLQKRDLAEHNRALMDDLRQLLSLLKSLHKKADLLASAELYEAGFYRHRGEWRRRRK